MVHHDFGPRKVSSCERCPPAWPCPLPTPAGRLFQRPPPRRRLGGGPREPALRPCGRPPCRPAAIFPRTTRPGSAPREQPWLNARLQAAHAVPLPGSWTPPYRRPRRPYGAPDIVGDLTGVFADRCIGLGSRRDRLLLRPPCRVRGLAPPVRHLRGVAVHSSKRLARPIAARAALSGTNRCKVH